MGDTCRIPDGTAFPSPEIFSSGSAQEASRMAQICHSQLRLMKMRTHQQEGAAANHLKQMRLGFEIRGLDIKGT